MTDRSIVAGPGAEAQQVSMLLSALISVMEQNSGEQGDGGPPGLLQDQKNQYLSSPSSRLSPRTPFSFSSVDLEVILRVKLHEPSHNLRL
ncbi:Hypothetical predicted protein [Xyrichtys novacula]|uniref:Uncharacterized protein n=1 Tax=Xyrichtys novacula TaxID=13765 RepID=A0AAV1EMQ3_XYRNO|nr:Hypothetical predicted protein [Xyrichtys novacula]